jgi:hypothetical protein
VASRDVGVRAARVVLAQHIGDSMVRAIALKPTDGVVRAPSALAITVASPPSMTATTEFVVPRSIPTARAITCNLRWTGAAERSSCA